MTTRRRPSLWTLIEDTNGVQMSSKRMIGFLGMASLMADIPLAYLGRPVPSELVTAFAAIVMAAFFGAVAERWGPHGTPEQPREQK